MTENDGWTDIRLRMSTKLRIGKHKKTTKESFEGVVLRLLEKYELEGTAATLNFNASPLMDILPGLIGPMAPDHQKEIMLAWRALAKLKDPEARLQLEEALLGEISRIHVAALNRHKYEVGAITLEDLNKIQEHGTGPGPFEAEGKLSTKQEGGR